MTMEGHAVLLEPGPGESANVHTTGIQLSSLSRSSRQCRSLSRTSEDSVRAAVQRGSCCGCKDIETAPLLGDDEEDPNNHAEVRCRCECFHKLASRMSRSLCIRTFMCNDVQLRLKTLLQVVFYYLDMLLDGRQLFLFHKKRQFTYLTLNFIGIVASCTFDFCNGNLPVIGPGWLVLKQRLLHERLPAEPTKQDLKASHERCKQLESLMRQMQETALVESMAEASVSLMVQGFALMFEKRVQKRQSIHPAGYTPDEELWLAISVAFSILTMSWAYCDLDAEGRILRRIDVQLKGASSPSPFPIVMGSLPFTYRLCILPVRYMEITARVGSVLIAAVSFKLQVESHAWLLTGTLLSVLACIDIAACLWKAETGAWFRLPLNFVARASPLAFPCNAPVLGPPALLFYTLRCFQNTMCWMLAIAVFNWSWGHLWEAFVCRAAGQVAILVVFACVFHSLVLLMLPFCTPSRIPLETRRAWGLLLRERPMIPIQEQQIMKVYGLSAMSRNMSNAISPQKFSGDVWDNRTWSDLANKEVSALASALLSSPFQKGRFNMHLTEFLSSKAMLKVLNIDCMDDEKVMALAPALKNQPMLEVFDISRNRFITVVGWKIISTEFLSNKDMLKVLNIGDCDMDDEKVKALAPALKNKPLLKAFIIRGNACITAVGWKIISTELLENKDELEVLNIGYCGMDDEKVMALAPALDNKPLLKELRISGNKGITAVGCKIISTEFLFNKHRLQVLEIACCDMDDEKVMALASEFRHRPLLKKLDMAGNRGMTTNGWEILSTKILEGTNVLEHLIVWGCDMDDDKLIALAPALDNQPLLKTLAMASNKSITAVGWKIISAQVLENKNELEALDVDGCDMDDAKVQALAPGLKDKLQFKSLDMDNHRISLAVWADVAAECLVNLQNLSWVTAEDVDYCTGRLPSGVKETLTICASEAMHVTSISISSLSSGDWCLVTAWMQHRLFIETLNIDDERGLTSAQWTVIAVALMNHQQLAHLHFKNCGMDDGAVQAVAPALRNNRDLRTLNMRANSRITANGWEIISTDFVMSKDWLEVLNIESCGMDDEKVMALAPALQNKPLLKRFNVSMNKLITAVGWKIISTEFLENKEGLEALNFSFCGMDDEKVRELAAGLKSKTLLHTLCMQGSRLTSEGWKIICDEVLAGGNQLKHLDISVCMMDDAGVQALAPGIGRTPFLKTFNMSRNSGLSADGWKMIFSAAFLSTNELEHFDISCCHLDDMKVQELAAVLDNKPSLKKLNMYENPRISTNGWKLISSEALVHDSIMQAAYMRRNIF